MRIMSRTGIAVLFICACLPCASTVYSASVSIYSPPDIPAIQFAAGDLLQALEAQGSRAALEPISQIPEKQHQTQFVLGLK